MIDTVILIVGFLCAGLVYSLCVIEYGLMARQHVLFSMVRKYVHQGPTLHAIVLALVVVSAVVSSVISNQLNERFDIASSSTGLSSSSTSALDITKE